MHFVTIRSNSLLLRPQIHPIMHHGAHESPTSELGIHLYSQDRNNSKRAEKIPTLNHDSSTRSLTAPYAKNRKAFPPLCTTFPKRKGVSIGETDFQPQVRSIVLAIITLARVITKDFHPRSTIYIFTIIITYAFYQYCPLRISGSGVAMTMLFIMNCEIA